MSSNSVDHPRPWSMTARLTGLFSLAALLILLCLGFYMYRSLTATFAEDNRQFLLKEIQMLQSVLTEKPVNLERLADEQREGLNLPTGEYYSRILDEQKHILSETPGMPAFFSTTQFPGRSQSEQSDVTIQALPDGRRFMLMTATHHATPKHTVQIGLDISHQAALLAEYRRNLAVALLIGLLFSALSALAVARRGLKPLVIMARHMEGVTATQLHEQLVAADYPGELFDLTEAFNAMLRRLDQSFAQLQQFSADLAHELRTPINNLIGECEVILTQPRSGDEYRNILESNLEEYRRLAQIIEALLFLARADNTEIALHKTCLDARVEVEAVCSYLDALAEDKQIRLVCEGEGKLYADSQLFKRVLSNLLLNAIQHMSVNGEIRVSIQTADDGGVDIRVQDKGCGIAAEHLSKLFDRFYRVNSARSESGTGLGLAIVKSIMDLHGGQIKISSELGQGTLVTLHFVPDRRN
jgi:two-component system, OmpR family, heavy metal sensor histidine kinase CusS